MRRLQRLDFDSELHWTVLLMDFYTNFTFKVQTGRGLRSCDPISKFWDPLITFERIELSASNLVQRWMTDPSCVWTIKRPLSGRGLGHVTQFRNFRTPYNFWMNWAILFKFGADIEDVPLQFTDHKTTPNWAWPGSVIQFLKFGTPYNFWKKLTYLLQIWYRDGGRILPTYDP